MSFIKVMKNKYYVKESVGNLVRYGLDIEIDEMNNYVPEEKWVGFGVNTISPSAVVESFNFVKRKFSEIKSLKFLSELSSSLPFYIQHYHI